MKTRNTKAKPQIFLCAAAEEFKTPYFTAWTHNFD